MTTDIVKCVKFNKMFFEEGDIVKVTRQYGFPIVGKIVNINTLANCIDVDCSKKFSANLITVNIIDIKSIEWLDKANVDDIILE